jgi:hypothetical protein
MRTKAFTRRETLNLLLGQLASLDITVQTCVTAWTWIVSASLDGKQQQFRAIILARSSDYWTKRYHLAKPRPTLTLCYEHDTCINLPVLSLHDGVLFAPCRFPGWFTGYEQRTSERGARVYLGALLSGVGSAHELLDHLPRSTKYRYEVKMAQHRKRARGKPVNA